MQIQHIYQCMWHYKVLVICWHNFYDPITNIIEYMYVRRASALHNVMLTVKLYSFLT
jgi:hypothetical protein